MGKSEILFDETYSSIQDWVRARQSNEDLTSLSKRPVVPFEPLVRELGISPIEGVERHEMTDEYQREITRWVGLVKSPFDLIQRAEGLETPQMVFYGSKNRATKNIEDPTDRAVVRSSAGRASIRRQFEITKQHHLIAKDRLSKASAGYEDLKYGEELSEELKNVTIEILQEMANGLAANLDNLFRGGDYKARIAGNSILAVAEGIEQGRVHPDSVRRLIYSAIGYVRKQEQFWDKKLTQIYDFASERDIDVSAKTESKED
jgi:hypothetical protein